MRAVDIAVGGGWLAFWLFWIATAARAKPDRSRWTRFAGLRVGLGLIALLLLRARAFRGRLVTHNPLLEGIGLALFAAGLALAIWARVCIGRNWGTPMSQKTEPELVTSGPYRSIRHPIYAGILLALIGTSAAISLYWLIAAAVLAAYFVYSAIAEERYLVSQFPDAYPAYQRSTTMLIPFLF